MHVLSLYPPMFRRFAITAVFLVTAAVSFAQEVTTQLSSERASVGEPVQLMVRVEGGGGIKVPQNITVNGLRIVQTGTSRQFRMGTNMRPTASVTYVYAVIPQFEGDFTIPAFEVQVDGRSFKTRPMQLQVSGQGRVPAPGQFPPPGNVPQGSQSAPSGSVPEGTKPFFAELVPAKRKAYVGEVIPVELRFFFSPRVGGQLGDRPNFSGEGFTVQKFSNASKDTLVRDGEEYTVFTYKTSVTPVKSGNLELPAASLPARLQLPGGGNRSGIPDIFGDMFPPGMLANVQEVNIETNTASIEVLPLPKEGRPETFSGAVGQFTLETAVSPKKAAPGEPVTLSSVVSGRGNFEGMTAPVLTQDDGWKSYPPSDKFSAEDAIGYGGTKTFDFTLIAREARTKTPGVAFSYFDPSTGKYNTLTSAPIDVEAKGPQSGEAAAPSAPASSAASVTPSATPQPMAPASVAPAGSTAWSPLLQRREFLIANAALALAWLALFGYFAVRRYSASAGGVRAARLQKARLILSRLRHANDAEFSDLAVSFLCTRLQCDPLAIDDRLAAAGLGEDPLASIRHVLRRHAEMKYGARGAILTPEERHNAIQALEELDRRAK